MEMFLKVVSKDFAGYIQNHGMQKNTEEESICNY